MKGAHLTLRVTADVARALDRRASDRDVPKSQLVREAVTEYLAPAAPGSGGRPALSARELARRWPAVPRLDVAEAREFAHDIAVARKAKPGSKSRWE